MFPIGRRWSVLAIGACLVLMPCSPSPAWEWRSAAEAREVGDLRLAAGDYRAAIFAYSHALRLDPGDAEAYFGRGTAYRQSRLPDEALADLTAALQIAPRWAEAYFLRGSVYDDKDDYGSAIADYTEALRLEYAPWQVVYASRGTAYLKKGDTDKAIADYSEALRLDPRDAATYYHRGNAWLGRRDYQRAIADYSEAIRLDPRLPEASENRCCAYS